MTVVTFTVTRETYAPILLEQKCRRKRQQCNNPHLRTAVDSSLTDREIFSRAIFRPVKMLLFQPVVFILSLYMAVVYGYLYLLFTTITALYTLEYHFGEGIVGLSYLGLGVGMFIGLFGFAITSDRVSKQLTERNGTRKPEYRLPPLIIGALFVPVGLMWYGWSAQAHQHWIMPIIGTCWVGVGLILTFMPISTYLVDAFTVHAASAMAGNTVLRSLVGAFLPLAGPQMYATLGLGWGNSLLAFIALALWPASILFYRYGESLRTSERFQTKF